MMNDEATRPHLCTIVTVRTIVIVGGLFAMFCMLLLFNPAAVHAQAGDIPRPDRCYAVANVPRDKLYAIDPSSGVPELIGEITTTVPLPEDPRDPQGGRDENAPTDIEALEFVPARNGTGFVLYAVSQRNFGTLDWTTAQFTPIGEIENGFGTVDGISFNNVDGIAYDPGSGRMFGVQRRRDGLTDLLFVINMETGDLEPDAFGPGRHYVEMSVARRGGTLTDLDDIEFASPVGDTAPGFYGVMNEAGAGAGRTEGNLLITIDPADGTILTKMEILRGQGERSCLHNNDKICDVEGLTFTPEGDLLATSGFNYRTALNNVYRIDPASGIADEIASLNDDYADLQLLDTESVICLPAQEPAIEIIKYTNGQDANDPDGAGVPIVAPGDPVTWTYKITNIGLVDIPQGDITVTDNIAGVNPVLIDLGDGDANLAPAESWLYQALGTGLDLVNGTPEANWVENVCSQGNILTSTATAYTNIGTVTIPSMSDTDPSSYCPTPAIELVKTCNGIDANTPEEAPDVPLGGTLNYTYIITNVGGMALSDLTLTDDPEGPVACEQDTLAIGESITCTLSRMAEETGLIANVGTVIAFGEGRDLIFDREEVLVTDEDPSHCRVIGPAIALDAELEFSWLYRLFNPDSTVEVEAVDLFEVVLNAGADIVTTLLSGDENDPEVLNPGETWTYGVTTPTVPASTYLRQYENTAVARAETDEGAEVSSTCAPLPLAYPDGLSLQVLLNGEAASTAPGLNVPIGAPLTWQYEVTNNLDQEARDLDVQQITLASDSTFVAATCDTNLLSSGASAICTVAGTAQAGPIATAATASARVDASTSCETPVRTETALAAGATTYYGQTDPSMATLTVRGRVFQDFASATTPANGLQEPDEGGVAGIVVTLVQAGDGSLVVPAVTTDEAGQYAIEAPAGSYSLQFEAPADHPWAQAAWTLPDQGTNDHLDSDVYAQSQVGAARALAGLEVSLNTPLSGLDAGMITPYMSDVSRIYIPLIAR
jgi:hypothetical protein